MFSRSKDKDTDKAAAPMAAPAPIPGKRPGTRTAPSIISNDLVVHGNLTATGDIQVDGTVEGDIRSQSLTIGEKASITGEIVAEDIVIRGRVVGTIRGRRVQLSSTCHVEGDILHEALAVRAQGSSASGPASRRTPASSPPACLPLGAVVLDGARRQLLRELQHARHARQRRGRMGQRGRQQRC